jgi:exodeoxyribonuclease III
VASRSVITFLCINYAVALMKLVSWNVNGLARVAEGLPEIHAALGEPDVFCLQETRVEVSGALPGFTCFSNTYRGRKMYGVATYVRSSLATEGAKLPWDHEGRVMITPVSGVVVVNVYAVNGTDRPHEGGTRHDFKRQFNKRLMEDLRALRAPLVLVGDWNISRSAIDTHPRLRTEEPHALARKLFNEQFIPGLDVVDVFRHLHPEARKYTWFRRSRTLDAARVDFALVSSTLLPNVVDADIREDERFGSDHAPITLELRTTR